MKKLRRWRNIFLMEKKNSGFLTRVISVRFHFVNIRTYISVTARKIWTILRAFISASVSLNFLFIFYFAFVVVVVCVCYFADPFISAC